MLDVLWNLASFVVALGILVTVHEYGHFWVARKNGVIVERFSIGFGQALWRKKDKYGTEFVIALIPLGGYVKMLDERVDDVAEKDKPYTFNAKNVYQRIAIIAAGPFANFAFAIIAYYFMFLMGVPNVKPVIDSTEPHSIAHNANLPLNSEITAINGTAVKNWQDITLELVSSIGNESVNVSTNSTDTGVSAVTTLDTRNWHYLPEKESAMASLGITPFYPKVDTQIAQIASNSPAELAGLAAGDKLIALNGKNIENQWQVFTDEVKLRANQEVTLEIERNNQHQFITVTFSEKNIGNKTVGYIGLSPTISAWPEGFISEIRYGVLEAAVQSIDKTWYMVRLSFDMIGKLITGNVSLNNLSGPISIAQGAGNSAGHGLVYFLSFLALISINLGIINLLPLPVLDGGHLLYYVIELITGKPVPDKIQEAGFKFGALALLGLMSIAIFNDISRLG